MTDNILLLLAILVIANIVLITVVVIRSYSRRRRESRYVPATSTAPGSKPASSAPSAMAAPAGSDGGYVTTGPFDPGPAPNRTDALTGLLLPGEWNRILGDEDSRLRRYGRPATVVLIELDGFDRLVAALGQEAGDRILPAVADAISRHARSADHFARLGPARFGILLPETGEVEAVNYVERIRQVCELWLEAGAIALRLAIGWAGPPVDGNLGDAFALAQDRMFAELRRSARRSGDLTPEQPPDNHDLEGSPSPA